MVIFLILLYIFAANGVIVPQGCFAAAWILTIVKGLADFIVGYSNSKKNKKR